MKNYIYKLILFICISIPYGLAAQTGGGASYLFLDLANDARLSSFGMPATSIYDDDINMAITNPSLINANMNNALSLSYNNYFGTHLGFASYSRDFNKIGTFVGTMQYINYGKFKYADEMGIVSGDFSANEIAAVIGWGRQLSDNWSIGANFKMIYSGLESYNSFAVAVDVAGTYRIPEKNFDMSLIVRNGGVELFSYASERSRLPFEIDYAMSVGFQHLPFRFMLLLHDLQKWNLIYDDPTLTSRTIDPNTGEPIGRTAAAIFGDNLIRHVTIGGEFTIAKIICLRFGYNFQRRQELRLSTTHAGLSGFSFGIGLDIYKFQIGYSHAIYSVAGATNCLTIKTNLSDWIK